MHASGGYHRCTVCWLIQCVIRGCEPEVVFLAAVLIRGSAVHGVVGWSPFSVSGSLL